MCSSGCFGICRLHRSVKYYTNNMITRIDNNDILTILSCTEYPHSPAWLCQPTEDGMQLKTNVSFSIVIHKNNSNSISTA